MFAVVFAAIGGLVIFRTLAAGTVSLYLSPQTDKVTRGKNFNVQVRLKNTTDNKARNVKVDVNFPASQLLVNSVDSSSSYYLLENKTEFDNQDGHIFINRKNKDNAGRDGKGDVLVSIIRFKAKATGKAAVTINKGRSKVGGDDNLLREVFGGSYDIVPPPKPSVSLRASPTQIYSGGSSTLRWSSSHASSCKASGDWSGSKATSGSRKVGPLNSQGNFSLRCTGSGGIDTATVVVKTVPRPVSPPPPVNIAPPPPPAPKPTKHKVKLKPSKPVEANAPVVDFVDILDVSPTEVKISWQTDIASKTEFSYGRSEEELNDSVNDKKFRTKHDVQLKNLVPGTINYFNLVATSIKGKDTAYASSFETIGLPVKFTVLTKQQPVASAKITVNEKSYTTNEAGEVQANLPPGEYQAVVESGGSTGTFQVSVLEPASEEEIAEQAFTFEVNGGGSIGKTILLVLLSLGALAGVAFAALRFLRHHENDDYFDSPPPPSLPPTGPAGPDPGTTPLPPQANEPYVPKSLLPRMPAKSSSVKKADDYQEPPDMFQEGNARLKDELDDIKK